MKSNIDTYILLGTCFILICFSSAHALADPEGTITGTVTTETPAGSWSDFQVDVYDSGNNLTVSTPVNSDGSYQTSGIAAGTYYVQFKDNSGEFQTEWFGNFPGSYYYQDSDPVIVAAGAATSGIDALLHRTADAAQRFYFSYSAIQTIYSRPHPAKPVTIAATATADIQRFSDGSYVPESLIQSFSVVTPSGTCTDEVVASELYLRDLSRDRNRNGLIDAGNNEYYGKSAVYSTFADCTFADTAHPAGTYQLQANFTNGQSITKNLLASQPYSLNEVPPVQNLAATWDDTSDALTVTWSIPTPPATYPPDTSLEIRVYSYKNGHWLYNQVRIRDLPVTLRNFTLTSRLTEPFNIKMAEQIRIEVQLRDSAATRSRSFLSYNFNAKNGTLVEAPISMTRLDVNGDGSVGLEEAIYCLKAASGN